MQPNAYGQNESRHGESEKPAEEYAAVQPFKGSTLIWRASQLRSRLKRGGNGKVTASNEMQSARLRKGKSQGKGLAVRAASA
jgi:hypothetical protein